MTAYEIAAFYKGSYEPANNGEEAQMVVKMNAKDFEEILEELDRRKPPTGKKHMENWSDPLVRRKVFSERMLRLRREVSRWQGKCAILRHENNKLREKLRRISQNVA